MERIGTSTNIFFERNDGSRIPAERTMRLCAQAGYRDMDFGFVEQIFYPTPFTTERWRSFVERHMRLAEELGIRFTQTHGHIHDFCNDQEEAQWDLVKRCVEGTAMLKAPWMVMHPSTLVRDGRVHQDTRSRNIEYFQRLAEYAGTFGVGIAVENMWGETKEGVKRYAITAEELCSLIDGIGKPNVGACWDTEHGAIEELSQPDSIRLLGNRLKCTHISDQTDRNNVHILPYTGFTDWDPILQALADVDYQGEFTYEIQHYLLAMPENLAPEAIRFSFQVGTQMIQRSRFLSSSVL
ncbi:MAG: sugar phosphate isomerase/epimerase [Hungatella sp.]|nr:sugar phosphate isomerase/epimerase [Hungatella sp.]